MQKYGDAFSNSSSIFYGMILQIESNKYKILRILKLQLITLFRFELDVVFLLDILVYRTLRDMLNFGIVIGFYCISSTLVPHYDLQISTKRTTIEILCVILGSDWQAINHCNVMYVLYVLICRPTCT